MASKQPGLSFTEKHDGNALPISEATEVVWGGNDQDSSDMNRLGKKQEMKVSKTEHVQIDVCY